MGVSYIRVPADLLELAYPLGNHIGFEAAEKSLRTSDGFLAYMGQGIRILYGISFDKEKQCFIMASNFGGNKFADEFDDLHDMFDAYALNYKRFRYISTRELAQAAEGYQRQEDALARTNSER